MEKQAILGKNIEVLDHRGSKAAIQVIIELFIRSVNFILNLNIILSLCKFDF